MLMDGCDDYTDGRKDMQIQAALSLKVTAIPETKAARQCGQILCWLSELSLYGFKCSLHTT